MEHRKAIALKFSRRFNGLVAALLMVLAANAAANDEALWRRIGEPGYLVLMRHAIAPGTGDPQDFRLDDCATQRNLSDRGRDQARRIGERFRSNGYDAVDLFSSQWCRCLETARLLALGEAVPLSSLNSFFRNPSVKDAQTQELLDWLARQPLVKPLVLVTHQVNITALSGVYPASGELVVVQRLEDGGLRVAGRIGTD